MSKPAFTLDANRMFRAMKIARADHISGKKCQPDAMLTAIGRSDLVAAKTVH